MRSMRYLNAVLTVIAVLLTLNLWTLWTLPGVPGAESVARAEQEGLVNAGAQRAQMIDLLKKQAQNQSDLMTLLKSGSVKVKVEGGEKK